MTLYCIYWGKKRPLLKAPAVGASLCRLTAAAITPVGAPPRASPPCGLLARAGASAVCWPHGEGAPRADVARPRWAPLSRSTSARRVHSRRAGQQCLLPPATTRLSPLPPRALLSATDATSRCPPARPPISSAEPAGGCGGLGDPGTTPPLDASSWLPAEPLPTSSRLFLPAGRPPWGFAFPHPPPFLPPLSLASLP